MPTRTEKIIENAIKILKSNSNGVRYSDLVRNIKKELPDIPVNTIHGIIWNLETRVPSDIYKPARGIFRHLKFRDEEIQEEEKLPLKNVKENNFYESFAQWLVDEIEECTKAIPLGGNKFQDKWGTPDVIGKLEPRRSDIVKTYTEIISAEIKTDADRENLITAFGQACAYKLFSHKSYIVVPKNSSESDISRLDALCLIFGIGLVLFDSNNPIDPKFEIRVRSIKHEPDMFYVNTYMKMIEKELFKE
ncbi:MAG: hypothetical protein QXD23_03825 [Candidatus Micrarchaeaceae archaeon]